MNIRIIAIASLLIALPVSAQKKKTVVNDSNTPLHLLHRRGKSAGRSEFFCRPFWERRRAAFCGIFQHIRRRKKRLYGKRPAPAPRLFSAEKPPQKPARTQASLR